MLNNLIILFFFMMLSLPVIGQHEGFIDELYTHTITDIAESKSVARQSDINFWKRNSGISFHVSARSRGDELLTTNSPSVITSAKINLLDAGVKASRLSARMLEQEAELAMLLGDEESDNHNYGIFYNYIIALYNEHKILQATKVVDLARQWNTDLKKSFHSKAVEQSALSESAAIQGVFQQLKWSHDDFNKSFSNVRIDIDLDLEAQRELPILNFQQMTRDVSKDTIATNVAYLRSQVLSNQIKKDNLSSLNAQVGYDMWRGQPILGLNYGIKLSQKPKNKIKQSIDIDVERIIMQRANSIKELCNFQYAYYYKIKQIKAIQYKIAELEKHIDVFEKQSAILNTPYHHDINAARTHIAELGYEWIDLEQQAMLILLRVKREIYPRKLSDYNMGKVHFDNRIYEHDRYVMTTSNSNLSRQDKDLLKDNELQVLSASSTLPQAVVVDPDDFDSRKSMESYIAQIPTNRPVILTSFDAFKELELRTIRDHMEGDVSMK